MIALLSSILALGFPLLLGLPLVLIWNLGHSRISIICTAWLLGVSAMATVLIPTGLVGVGYKQVVLLGWLVLSWAVYGMARHCRYGRRPLATDAKRPVAERPTVASWPWLFAGLSLLNLLIAAVVAYRTPIIVWDVQQFWLPKAEALLPPGTLRSLAGTIYPDYPPLWPLHIGMVRMIAGTTAVAKLLPVLYLTALLGLVYTYLAEYTNRATATMAIWFISGIPYLHFYYGLMDLLAEVPFMVMAGAATINLARYVSRRETQDAAVAMVFSSTVILVRPEGFEFALVIALGVAGCAWREGRRALSAMGLIVPVMVFASWQLVVRLIFAHGATYRISAKLWDGQQVGAFGRILGYAARELANPFIFGPTVIAFAILIMAFRSWRSWLVHLAVFVACVGLICLTYLVLPSTNEMPLDWWLQTGFKRMLLHFTPLLTIGAALAVHAMANSGQQGGPSLDDQSSSLRGTAGYLLTALVLVVAAWYYSGLFRTGSIHLVNVITSGQINLSTPVDYGDEKKWWQVQTHDTLESMMTCPVDGRNAEVTYDISNLGLRGGSESVLERFVRFKARVGLVATKVGRVRFFVFADDKQIAATPEMTGLDKTITISADLPVRTRILRLVVDPMGDPNSDHAVWFEPRLIRGGSGSLVAVALLLGAACATASAYVAWRVRQPGEWSHLIGIRPILVALTLAALIIQMDAVTNRLCRFDL